MAYVNPLDYEEQWRGLMGAPRAAQPAPISTSAGGGTAAPGPGAPPPSAPQRAPGTGYVNFNTYLDLNRPGGEAMAGRVAGELEGASAGVQADLAGQQRAFRDANQPGTPADYNASAWNALLGRAQDTEARGRLATPTTATPLLQDAYGRGRTYSGGERAWDLGLMGMTGAGRLRQGAESTMGLSSLLGAAGQERHSEALPGKGPQTETPPKLPPAPEGGENPAAGVGANPPNPGNGLGDWWRRQRGRDSTSGRSNPRGGP